MSKFLLAVLDRIQDDAIDEIKITETDQHDVDII